MSEQSKYNIKTLALAVTIFIWFGGLCALLAVAIVDGGNHERAQQVAHKAPIVLIGIKGK